MSVWQKIKTWASRYEFTQKLVEHYGFRTIVFSVGSLALSTIYALFNGVIATLNFSLWYGALASYYILLTCMRGSIIFHHRRSKKAVQEEGETVEQTQARAVKTYRSCGIVLVFLPLCLSGAVIQMALSKRSYVYGGLMIYGAAAYTFYKITMSVINVVKARKADDPTVRAVRNINFADALVSVLALQTALIHAFSPDTRLGYMNAVTGGIVCALTVIIGVYMIVTGNLQLKHGITSIPAEQTTGNK